MEEKNLFVEQEKDESVNAKAAPENKMGVMPINKLILNMGIPMMLSMLVQALYNVVDSIFVAKLSEDALTAASLAFPAQNIMIALGAGTGVGINALLSRSLGAKESENANKAANNGIFLMFINFVLCALFGIFGTRWFLSTQTTDITIINYGDDYLSIIMICSMGLFGQMVFERLLQSTGRTLYSMYTQALGAVINMILDPIMIFGLLGCPALGMKGAAIATVIGQACAMFLGIYMNIKKNPEIKLSLKLMKPDLTTVGRIYAVGLPSIIMMSIGSAMTYGMNRILIKFSNTATAVFGAYFKLQSFFFMPVIGLNNGIVPIVSYNYGAKNKDRMMKAYKYGILYAVSIMAMGCAVFEIFPKQLFMLFSASEHMLSIGVPALRIIGTHFVVAGFCIITGTMFQALGNGFFSMVISICRQIVVLLPAAYLLSLTGNVNAVWWAFPIAEVASATFSTIFFKILYNQKIKNL